ncbi:hypothetical protein ACVNIS_00040 [Sphaerotilaceae bacterium SBD11-9]
MQPVHTRTAFRSFTPAQPVPLSCTGAMLALSAGGPWWGTEMFNIEPTAGADKPQMTVLRPYL